MTVTDLDKDAKAIGRLLDQWEHADVQWQRPVADRLAAVQNGNGWSLRALAEWCEEHGWKRLSFGYIGKLLCWRRALQVVCPSDTDPVPTVWTLEPLSTALNGKKIKPGEASELYRSLRGPHGEPPSKGVLANALRQSGIADKDPAPGLRQVETVSESTETGPVDFAESCQFACRSLYQQADSWVDAVKTGTADPDATAEQLRTLAKEIAGELNRRADALLAVGVAEGYDEPHPGGGS
jgi:hypothetical protein